MIFYIGLFLTFLYFKIVRVHKKEEKLNFLFIAQHIVVALSTIGLYSFGFMHLEWYFVLVSSFIFFIVAAMMITAVQIGIFKDGVPLFGLSHIYKALPILTLAIANISLYNWIK